MATGLLFERDAVEEIERWDDGLTRRRRSSVLWIDVERLSDQKESAPKFVGGKDRVHLTCYARPPEPARAGGVHLVRALRARLDLAEALEGPTH